MPDKIFPVKNRRKNKYWTDTTREPEINFLENIPKNILREGKIGLPQLSESQVVRHFTNLARKNYGVDDGIYPLGSCTMKYNPKVNEDIAKNSNFSDIHPCQKTEDVQGTLKVMYELGEMLKEIIGLSAITLHPSAGAHGEFCGLLIARKYFEIRNENRKIIIIPDSAHGTNFASAAMAGFNVIEVKSNKEGTIDLKILEELLKQHSSNIALVMITNPNTLGIFEKDILKISSLMHENGSLMYYDGANLNAVIGMVRPGDMGFDIVHLNLHKTFSTPHGGGGPGAGPILVNESLKDFLPVPVVIKKGNKYLLDYDIKNTIGKIKSFYGNFSVCLKAYCYILSAGNSLKEISNDACLNANYLKVKLSKFFDVPYSKNTMHEFVMSAKKYKESGGTALNIAKRLIDYKIHPPTIYFPHIVEEALMVEPTETESLESLENLIGTFEKIVSEIKNNPEVVINSPVSTETKRVDELRALKEPVFKE